MINLDDNERYAERQLDDAIALCDVALIALSRPDHDVDAVKSHINDAMDRLTLCKSQMRLNHDEERKMRLLPDRGTK